MTFQTKMVCSGFALLALAACGGGSSGGSEVLFANDVGSVAKALDDGRTLSAKHAASLDRVYDPSTTSPAAVPFTLSKSDDGELVMTVDGTEISFTNADRDGDFGYTDDTAPGFLNLSSSDGELADDLDPTNESYANVFNYYLDTTGEGANFGFVVIGTATELADLEALTGDPTYGGFMNLNFHQQTDFFDFSADSVRVRGDMSMVADFDTGMISGSSNAGQLTLRDGDTAEVGMDGQVFFTATMIDGTSFGGTITADGDFYTATSVGLMDAEYEGSFYGPSGGEVAGVMSGTSAEGYNVLGQFNAEAP